jgi:peptide/nickel transport system substrate-binding protein
VRRAVLACVGILSLGVAACDTADAANRPELPKQGGVLRLILGTKVENLDPQKIAAATDANISRLFTRTLTTFRSEPGAKASEIVGDLATDTGRPTEGNQVWDFTLKKDVKWQDGTPITCAQVKYGVERNFSSLFTTGLQYPRQLLQDNATPYEGPFKGDNNNKRGMESVQCVDAKSIRFRLKQPVGDFGYAAALSVFAPVPLDKDADKAAYNRKPFSSGPYKIVESTDAKIVLDRNPYWSQGSDAVRHAYPDQILITVNDNGPAVSYALIQDQGDAQNSVQLDLDVASNFVQQVVNDTDLSKRLITGSHTGVRYLAINTRRITNVKCRQALEYAANKRKFRSAMGGSTFGELASTAVSPSLRSHKDFDLYETKQKPEGDRDKARQLWTDPANKCPARISIAFPQVRKRLMQVIAESFNLAGIETDLKPVDPTKINYFSDAIGRPSNQYDVMWAGWIADWANGSAVLPPQFDGNNIPKGEDANGNQNFALLNVPEINSAISEAMAESNLEQQYRLWGELDEQIMKQAPIIPLLYMTSQRLVGSNVRGAFIHPQFGAPDVCALGLAKP